MQILYKYFNCNQMIHIVVVHMLLENTYLFIYKYNLK